MISPNSIPLYVFLFDCVVKCSRKKDLWCHQNIFHGFDIKSVSHTNEEAAVNPSLAAISASLLSVSCYCYKYNYDKCISVGLTPVLNHSSQQM